MKFSSRSSSLPAVLRDAHWRAVRANDGQMDGIFVYAVRTTGIYCRPSCTSRLPKPENVAFFATPAEAETAGFRACKRCRPVGIEARDRSPAPPAQRLSPEENSRPDV